MISKKERLLMPKFPLMACKDKILQIAILANLLPASYILGLNFINLFVYGDLYSLSIFVLMSLTLFGLMYLKQFARKLAILMNLYCAISAPLIIGPRSFLEAYPDFPSVNYLIMFLILGEGYILAVTFMLSARRAEFS